MGSVDDLANGLKYVGPVAASMGISLEETTGTLALFASQGIIGEQAGTSLRGMLSSLTSPSAAARGEMERLGISLYDNSGNFAGMANVAGQLTKVYSQMTPEMRDASLGMIFGNEQITAARVLYAGGADAVRDWTAAVDDTGYAAETAAMRLDNLTGDVEGFGGAADTAFIKTGAQANDALRTLVQTGTALIDVYNEAPEAMQSTAFGLAAIGTAVGLAGGAFFLAAPKVVEFRTAVATLRQEAPKTMGAVSGISKAVGTLAGITVILGVLESVKDSMRSAGASAEELNNSLLTSRSGAETFETAMKGLDDIDHGAISRFSKDWGQAIKDISASPDTRWLPGFTHDLFALDPVADEARTKLAALGSQIASMEPAEAQRAFRMLADEMGGSREATQLLLDNMPDYNNKLIEQASSLGLASTAQNILRLAMQDGGGAAEDQAEGLAILEGKAADTGEEIDALSEQILNFGKAQLDLNAAQRDFEAAADAVSESLTQQKDAYITAHGNLDGFNASLDIGTAEGRENKANLDEIASSALSMSSATLAQTGSQEKASAALAAGRQRLIEQLGQFGITGQAAENYANELGLIPSNISTAMQLTGYDQTYQRLMSLQAMLRDLTGNHSIHVATGQGGQGGITQANGAVVDYYANGGMRENHVAQIAPAGAYRVWAESETGGEAYIPLSPAKRARSLEIWTETGRRLGVAENYRGAVSNGGMYAGSKTVTNAIQIDVHPAPGMNEEALTDRVVSRVERLLK
jgi:hypothetical protein